MAMVKRHVIICEPISANPPDPLGRPVMRQSWQHVTFLHWPYEESVVRRLVPSDLQLDLHDGRAWVGLVPFLITDLTHPRAAALPWLSSFPETNVRTYVIDRNGLRGVWFFSLDASRLLAVLGARVAYALPYFWASMSVACAGETVHYSSTRLLGPDAVSEIEIQIGEVISNPTELELFLTARFRLYAKRGRNLLRADIEHAPWPLRRAGVADLAQNLVHAAGLPDVDSEPLAHFAHRVDVLVGRPKA